MPSFNGLRFLVSAAVDAVFKQNTGLCCRRMTTNFDSCVSLKQRVVDVVTCPTEILFDFLGKKYRCCTCIGGTNGKWNSASSFGIQWRQSCKSEVSIEMYDLIPTPVSCQIQYHWIFFYKLIIFLSHCIHSVKSILYASNVNITISNSRLCQS